MSISKIITNFLSAGSERTKMAKKNILLNFANKGVAIIVSLLIVSTTINYLDPINYGIWITITSIVQWAGYFDLGLGHGFRNRFAIAKARGCEKLAKEYVSTTYFVMSVIFILVFFVFCILNSHLQWNDILKVEIPKTILQKTFIILIGFFSIQSVLNIISILLQADQRPAFSSIIYTIGQVCALIGIVLLTKINNEGSIISLSYILSGIPCLVFFIISVVLFSSKYRSVSPRIASVKFIHIKDIFSLGGKFFLIQLSMLFIFQCTNIIVTRNLGPEYATVYNVAYRYFNIVFMIAAIVLTPFWSAFTEAYEKNDFAWMRAVYNKLSKLWWFSLIGIIIMIVLSKWVYHVWLGGNVDIPISVSIAMGIYIASMIRGAIYMYLINGIGKVTIQLLAYLCFAIISIPLLIYSCNLIGVIGPILIGTLVYVVQGILGHIQLKMILTNKARGLWNK